MTKIENFLQIASSEVGLFIEGNHKLGKRITIAHTGEMMRHWRDVKNHVGHLVVDDCERCPSKVFTYLIPNFDTYYMLGLAGTAQRRDRLSRFIYYYIGDMVYSITEKDAREGRGIIPAYVVARSTEFEYPYQSRTDYHPMLRALMQDHERTRLIADDIEAELSESSKSLVVLSGGEEQSQALAEDLKSRGIEAAILAPPPGAEDDETPMDIHPEMPSGNSEIDLSSFSQYRVLLVTPQTLTQCFRNLDSKVLFLAIPLYFKKQLAHAIRNLYHGDEDNGDRLKIYDYVDQRVGLLENYFRMRSYNYGVHPNALLDTN
jgi:hypothetical protein